MARTRFSEVYPRCGRAVCYRLYKAAMVHFAKVNCYTVPLPELGLRFGNPMTAGGGQTSYAKWALIRRALPEGLASALDIGCNNGFFSLRLAREGLFTLGLDPDEDLLRLASLAALEAKVDRAAFCAMALDPANVRLLPDADVVLVLSVMHRWVSAYGREEAEAMLRRLWGKTRACLFFESPNPVQNSKQAAVLSYMGSTEAECEHFLIGLLESLGGCDVSRLGYLPTDFRANERRHLLLARRRGAAA
jgi:SAM-dependent methyltransferase